METSGRITRMAFIVAHAVLGCVFCFALTVVGRIVTSMDGTIMILAVGAPCGFAVISLFYFRRFGFTTPFATAALFLLVVIVMDVVVVASLIQRSFAMFENTWLFYIYMLIFLSTYFTGRLAKRPG